MYHLELYHLEFYHLEFYHLELYHLELYRLSIIDILMCFQEKKEVFEASDKEAVNALVDVIATFNLLQVEKYYGFPLGSLVAHLRAYLYEPILKEQFTFYTTITLSGEQHGTGSKY